MNPCARGILLLLTLLIGGSARANDSNFEGVGGSLRPTQGENKAIRMARETVVLTADAETYSTRADFVFRNDSARAQTVEMGFPEGYFEDAADDKTTFIGFRTSVDGQRVEARRTVLKKSQGDFNVYWLKTVSFAPHQTRRVRVEFASPYGGSTNWGLTRAMAYAFTGGNWRGRLSESVLEVRISRPGLWRAVAVGAGDKMLPFALTTSPKGAAKGAVFRRVWKNWEAEQTVTFGLERAQPFWRQDRSGPDNGDFTMKSVAAAQTVRVGAKPKNPEESQGFPPDGFTRDGTFYVGAAHLSDRLDVWGSAQKPPATSKLEGAGETGFVLSAGKTRIEGQVGALALRVNGKTIALGAPIVLVPHSGQKMLYIPLAPLATALGMRVSFQGERLFRLERGSWRG